jgi:hypothetical protein
LTKDFDEILRKLRESQALEIPVWLHLLGKFRSEFYSNSSLDKVVPAELDKTRWIGIDWCNCSSSTAREGYTIGKAITKHREQPTEIKGILDILNDSHGRSSGIDKGWMVQKGGSFSKSGEQQSGTLFRASPFGYELAVDTIAIDTRRSKLYIELDEILKNKCQNVSILKLAKKCKRYFEDAPSETRRPMNDITLDDATETAVAFFRSAMAEYIDSKAKEKPKWKVARFNLDTLDYIMNALEIPDLKGRERKIDATLDQVKLLIENEIPIGLEIFRDEYGAIFIVSEIWESRFKVEIEKRVNEILRKELDHDFSISLESTAKANRSLVGLQELAGKQSIPLNPQLDSVESKWNGVDSPASLCMICGWNPIKKKERERNRCSSCSQMKVIRASEWSEKLDTTIWMDEVSDKYGQVALICGQFEFDRWLDGSYIRTIMNWDTSRFSKKKFYEAIEKWENGDNSDIKGHLPYFARTTSFEETLEFHADQRTITTDKSKTLAWLLLSQLDSPARMMRVWRTTREFWETCKSQIESKNKHEERLAVTTTDDPDSDGAYVIRLKDQDLTIPVYWAKENRQFISIINPELVEQLYKFPAEKDLSTTLREYNGQVEIVEPGGYGKQQRSKPTRIREVNTVDREFTSVVDVMTTPRSFMMLVPADKVIGYLSFIKEKYENEMGFVRNRLPIHLGVIVGDRRTPIRVFLDASRRILKQHMNADEWTIDAIGDGDRLPSHLQANAQFTDVRFITLSRDGRELNWVVPLKMGDGQTSDQWYGYCIVDKFSDPKKTRVTFLEVPDPENEGKMVFLCHVSEVEVGDKIRFKPSTFDFEHIGNTSTRFEICYNEDGTRKGRNRRPYLLEELETITQVWKDIHTHLTISQIHRIIEMIETKRTEWNDAESSDPVFLSFCHAVLKTARWKKNEDSLPWNESNETQWFNRMAKLAADGVLTDSINLHMRIIKSESK